MGCKQSNEKHGTPINKDVEVRKKFITGTHITHIAGGIEGNLQLGYYKHKQKKYEVPGVGGGEMNTTC